MIIVDALNDNGLCDVRVIGITNDFYIVQSDFSRIEEAIGDYDNSSLIDGCSYRFTLKPMYEDDGSGAMRLDWYDIVEFENVTIL